MTYSFTAKAKFLNDCLQTDSLHQNNKDISKSRALHYPQFFQTFEEATESSETVLRTSQSREQSARLAGGVERGMILYRSLLERLSKSNNTTLNGVQLSWTRVLARKRLHNQPTFPGARDPPYYTMRSPTRIPTEYRQRSNAPRTQRDTARIKGSKSVA